MSFSDKFGLKAAAQRREIMTEGGYECLDGLQATFCEAGESIDPGIDAALKEFDI
tara:strand:+ start:516 stop:680 length:165 start_codon:yes stop_codon:yes gene_type:complete